MFRINITAIAAIALFWTGPVDIASAAGKCTSISTQCAVEIGGRCDPKTGRWEYGNYGNRGSGGTNRGGVFDVCLSRKLKERK
jgi:hypothetical protein